MLSSFQSKIFSKMRWNQWGLESGPERGGNASGSENIITKQDYKKLNMLRLEQDSAVLFRKRCYSSYSFVFKKTIQDTSSFSIWYSLGPCVPVDRFTMPI